MHRRRFLIGVGSATVVLTACGSDDPVSTGGSGGEPTTSTTGPLVEGSTPADAELIAAALGEWETISSYTDTGYAVTIVADGTFTMRALDPEEFNALGAEAAGTWDIDDGTLSIELVVSGDEEGEPDEVLACVLEDAFLDTDVMKMAAYTIDGSDYLDPDGINVEVAWEGSEVLLNGSWQCTPG